MNKSQETKVNLLGYSRAELISWLARQNIPKFRSKQLIKWIHQKGVLDFLSMTDLPYSMREELNEIAIIKPPLISEEINHDSQINAPQKYLISTSQNNKVEMVLIPQESSKSSDNDIDEQKSSTRQASIRQTLCISTQAGCAVGCPFCATGKQGFNSNLTSDEIIGQLWLGVYSIDSHKIKHHSGIDKNNISNVVFMGMGEPLLNFEPVMSACDLFLDDEAYGLSRRKVTISTSGVVPMIDRMCGRTEVALAVSLHSSDDELRNELVPINKKYPISDLLSVCKKYLKSLSQKDRQITFEYTMLDGINDSISQAKDLARILANIPCKINLIPYNPSPFADYKRSSDKKIYDFSSVLINKGYIVTTRKTRGSKIKAACGQLSGEIISKSKQKSNVYKI